MIKTLADGNQSAFGRAVGIATGTLAGFIGERQVKPGFEILQKIGRAYPQVRWEWLMFGEGSMLKKDDPEVQLRNMLVHADALSNNELAQKYEELIRRASESLDEPRVVSSEEGDTIIAPVVNYKAAANYASGYNSQEHPEQLDVMSFPKYMVRGSTHTVFPVVGDSMTPTFLNRDYVWCRFIPKSDWRYLSRSLADRKVYVVVSKPNGLQIKRVSLDGTDCLRCESDNRQLNPPFTLEFDEIEQIWEVQWRITNNFESLTDTLGDKVNSLEDKYEMLNEQVMALLRANNLPIVK